MKKKLLQLDHRLRKVEAEVENIKKELSPESRHRMQEELDKIEVAIEEEVSAATREMDAEAKKWVEDEKRFIGVDDEKPVEEKKDAGEGEKKEERS